MTIVRFTGALWSLRRLQAPNWIWRVYFAAKGMGEKRQRRQGSEETQKGKELLDGNRWNTAKFVMEEWRCTREQDTVTELDFKTKTLDVG